MEGSDASPSPPPENLEVLPRLSDIAVAPSPSPSPQPQSLTTSQSGETVPLEDAKTQEQKAPQLSSLGLISLSPLEPAKSEPQEVTPDYTTLYSSPLVMYKRNNPILRRRRPERSTDLLAPCQIMLPDGALCLGFPPAKQEAEEDEDGKEIDEEELVVFSQPGEDQHSRSWMLRVLLSFLLAVDLALVIFIFARGTGAITGAASNSERDTEGILSFVCTIMVIVMGAVCLVVQSSRLITLFMVLFYIDSILTLLRAYSILQFAHFVLQVAVCHFSTELKGTWVSAWFFPSS